MVSPEQLERVLRDFNFTYGTQVAGILTRTGAPIAIQANVDIESDHFATMVATLVGSMDVLYRGVGLRPPKEIAVDGDPGLIVVLKVGPNVLFAALGPRDAELRAQRAEALERLQQVLEPLKPLEKFLT